MEILILILKILSILLFVITAMCNALMDVIQFHWDDFRWKDKVNEQWWNPAISHLNKYIDGIKANGKIYKGWLGWVSNFLDAWHFSKMIMIILFALSAILFPYSFKICIFENNIYNIGIWLMVYGIAWNVPFNYCYNNLFIKND